MLEPSEAGDGVLGTDLGADGAAGKTMVFPTLGTRGLLSSFRDPFQHRLHFDGQTVFKIAVRGIEASVRRTLDRCGLTAADVDAVVPHQANERIINAATRRLVLEPERVMVNIGTHGNSAAASVPMALADALEAGMVRPGSIVVQTAFGGGVTWGTTVMRWGDRAEPLGRSDAELAPCDKSVFEPPAANRDFYAPLHAGPAD